MLGTVGVGGDEGQVDGGLRGTGELDLGLLRRFGETLQSLTVFSEVDAFVLLELVGQVVDNALVEVITTQVGVTGSGQDFENAITHLEDGHIKRAAAKVKDQDGFVRLAVEAIGQGSSGGLVNDAEDLNTGNATGVLRGLALRIVEVSGDGDDGFLNGGIEEFGGIVNELAKDLGGNFFGREKLVQVGTLNLHVVVLGVIDDHVRNLLRLRSDLRNLAANEALNGKKSVLRVNDSLTLRNLSHESITILGVRNDRRSRPTTFRVGNNSRRSTFHHRNSGVGGTKINTDNLGSSLTTSGS
mmetsp:Transcript_33606/g.60685  ORF Transcript_33606/g.60685 Transcript_33606/m.60685 type:complete len:299 (+) Transcript_33606:1153-2049(+)